MNYLVMECHKSYAVVMASNGSFIKVANLHYQVGQKLDSVVTMNEPPRRSILWNRQLTALLASAACLCFLLLGSWQLFLSPIGTVRLQINPDVLLSVNRLNYVTGLEGLNEDGTVLIEEMHTFGKKADAVAAELASRSIGQGYLKEGGQILLTVDSGNEKWKTSILELLVSSLTESFGQHIQIITAPEEKDKQPFREADKEKLPSRQDTGNTGQETDIPKAGTDGSTGQEGDIPKTGTDGSSINRPKADEDDDDDDDDDNSLDDDGFEEDDGSSEDGIDLENDDGDSDDDIDLEDDDGGLEDDGNSQDSNDFEEDEGLVPEDAEDEE